MVELQFNELGERCTNKERVVLRNTCDFDLSVIIKDDATHIYNEKLAANSLFNQSYSCIWNDDGDSLYIWDEDGLVLFYRYP